MRHLANHGHELCPTAQHSKSRCATDYTGHLTCHGPGGYSRFVGQWCGGGTGQHWIGAHKQEGRCALLWQKLQAYYNVIHIRYELQNLILSMLKPSGKPPKVRGTRMQVRCIMYFGL